MGPPVEPAGAQNVRASGSHVVISLSGCMSMCMEHRDPASSTETYHASSYLEAARGNKILNPSKSS